VLALIASCGIDGNLLAESGREQVVLGRFARREELVTVTVLDDELVVALLEPAGVC
jgi:hypothetical protein